jgi:hypothetical protein
MALASIRRSPDRMPSQYVFNDTSKPQLEGLLAGSRFNVQGSTFLTRIPHTKQKDPAF